jgi:hypothetical protein
MPVTKLESLDARKRAAVAISSVRQFPARDEGVEIVHRVSRNAG